ncbi:MAG: hypothetical protein NTY67_14920, partial [Cyanobacteria bacterium]|nr:hypothetical protein [Cyanobacteriota bacterium]
MARFSGTIYGTTLTVSPLSSGSLAIGDLILGDGVQAGTTVTAVTRAASASSAGSYQVNTSQTVSSTNLAAVPLSGEIASTAIAFAGSFSGSGNTTLTLSSGATALQVGDQLFGVGIDPGTFITGVISVNAGSGAGSFQVNHGPASTSGSGSAALLALPAGTPSPDSSQTLTTPVLSWSEAVRTPYDEAVLSSQPLLFVPFGGLVAGINSLNLGSASTNTETFASSTGLNTSIAGALPKSTASAVQNVKGLGVLATGLGSLNSPTLDALRNTPQTPAIAADSPVAIFSGAINGTSLTITNVSQGTLAVGELVVGEGIPAGTTIAALPSSATADQSGVYTLAYASGADSSTTLAATTLRSLPTTGRLPLVSFEGSFSGSAGANGYTSLAITNLSATLQVGDQVLGLGLPGGSTIKQVQSLDLNSGTAQVIVSQGPQSAGGSYGLAASSGGSSSPYTLEFWTQLDAGSNPAGAGLVALGQPSDSALPDRPAELPEGWLLSSSFGVERLTWQDALNLSLETSLNGNMASDLYGWRWAVVADGANTTAMDGTGGSNLYRNSLLLNNLLVGDTIEGVESFLAAYGLSSSDLIGLDGTPANQIAASPTTQFQFTTDFRPNQALAGESVPTTSLNGVAIDTSTDVMNGGIVKSATNTNANLTDMLNALWDFEQTYGQAKVNFSLNPITQPAPPTPSPSPILPSANKIEQYGGYELKFVLQNGPAVSVNASGQIVFDVAPGVTLVSTDGIDYRDNAWHYVAASFLPDFVTVSASGTALNLPRNVGTAYLYIDGKQVVSLSNVVNPYGPTNLNDAAQLLSDNAGGALDLLAVYNQALTTSQPPAKASDWPMPTSTEALALLKEAGFVVASKTPNPGQQPGAISNHYLAHTVDPNNAAKSTFTSALLPDANGGLSWSEASTLNPEAAIRPTTASASSPSLQSDLLIPIATTAWGQQGWFTNAAPTTAVVANPAGQTLKGITVTLTPTGGGTAVIRQLSTEEVLLGTTELAALQPKAQDANFAYTFLSNAPALNLLISREPSGTGDSNNLDPTVPYSASVKLQFADGTSLSNTSSGQSAGTVVPLGFSTSLAATLKTDSIANSKALATADVLEAAPLQLKYIDSGVQLSSQNSPSDPTPASSFGNSQVYGCFTNTGSSTNSGWLAISQPRSSNAVSDPAGRVWVNFAGAFTTSTDSQGNQLSSAVSDPAQAPTTWLNALAASDFSPNRPNLPLLNSALYQSSVGGLLIKADASAGWGQNFGATMLVADVDNDGTDDLVIAAPQANGGGAVVIVDGTWIADNLTSSTGQTILDLSNPGPWITVLRPGTVDSSTDITTVAGFGSALAFQSGGVGQTGTLWIGAPNYLRTLDSDPSNKEASTQAIGALYSYNPSAYAGSWDATTPTVLSDPILGSGGTVTIPKAGNSTSTSWWGAQLGTAVALSSDGQLAVSAPGVVGSIVYTGTEALTQKYTNFDFGSNPQVAEGLIYKFQGGSSIDATKGADSSLYTIVSGLQAEQLSATQKAFLNAFREQQLNPVVPATMQNNQAVQASAIGAVVVFKSGTNLNSLANTGLTAASVNALNGRTYYGANPYNTLGDSGFGSSLSFADLTNSNSDQLIVGASQSGGGGMVYMFDPNASYSDNSLGFNQHLAVLAATNIVTAAEATDYLGSGLVNLGDVNGDQIDDVLIQAYNAASSAGIGYVLFGSDQLSTSNTDAGLMSLAPGSIGTIEYGNGTSSSLAILSELGSAGGITGQGSYGPGDYNANGLNDVPLGSGPNAKGYLTWGQPYLEAISDLQLSKLSSNTGFLLAGLATTTEGSLRSIGDFNADGYGDFMSINPGPFLTNVRIELGANTQEILADAPYSYYSFTVANGTEVLPGGDINGDGMDDIVLFLDQNLSSSADGNQGAGSTTGILYGRASTDLPLGSGFGYIAPVDPNTSAPLTPPPGLLVEGSDGLQGLTDATPAVIAVGDTLYAAVKGYGDNTIWFTQSLDGGSSWDSWSELTRFNSGFSTSTGPSLLNFGGKIYLSFVNSGGTLSLSSWDPGSTDLSAWSAPVALSDGAGTADFSSTSGPQLVDRGISIGVLWVQNGTVVASTNTDPSSSTSTWSKPGQLQQLVGGSGTAIEASAAPSFAWLGTSAVLAVNDGGVINVYGALGGSSSLQLASTFTAPSGGPTITSAPVLTTSDTGLVLTYTNSDGSISVNRLDLLSPGGTPLPGVTFTANGGVDVSEAAINWQTTTLTDANSGISSALASTPVVVQGNLLLANVRNSSTPDNQIWLNAIPNASDPASTTWLNTTVQLPDGNGGAILSQRAGIENSIGSGLGAGSWQDVGGGGALSAAALTRNGNTVYMAVRGTDDHLYWNSSSDNGKTWNSWQGLPTTMGTYTAPSIAYFNKTLYLCYVAAGSNDLNITYLNGSTWETQYQISGQTATAASMITEGSNLAVYFVSEDASDRILKSYTSSSTPSSTDWTNTSVEYGSASNQTASGNLALTRYNGQTYIAYQGGTVDTPSNTIYLTTASDSVANGSSPVWTLLETPTGIDPVLKRGVGLTSNGQGLVLTYTDTNQPNQVAVQLSNADVSGWLALDDNQALSSDIGYTPLITADTSNPLLIAGMTPSDTYPVINAQLNSLNVQILSSAQTGSTLSAVGDINGDGYDDLAISANNVAYSPSGNFGSSDAQLSTGVRLVLGAATATALSGANNASASQQTVQIADLYGQPGATGTASSVTPLANLSGPSSLTLSGRQAGNVVQITSTAPGSPLSDATLSANASDASSLNQLFAGASASTTPIAGWHTAKGTGSASAQTLAGYGDLNADGYVDYLAPDGLQNVYSSDGAIVYDVWSIRAAGDVNGNGVDDLLLTLSPAETSGQWLQTALVDGSLFHVENNQFSLAKAEGSIQKGWTSAGLKAPLAPYQYAYSDGTPPGLQQWVQSILNYQPGNQLTSLSTGTQTTIDSLNSADIGALASAVDSDGTVYIAAEVNGTVGQLFYGPPNASANTWTVVGTPKGGIPTSVAIYDGSIFILEQGTAGALTIQSASLKSDLSAASSWSAYTPSGITGSTGQIVNEGDRLALYYVNTSGSNKNLVSATFATSTPTSSLGVKTPVTSSSWGGTLGATGFSGAPVSINVAANGSSNESGMNAGTTLTATRFQGKTILAYYSSPYNSSSSTLYVAESNSREPGSSFTSNATSLGVWNSQLGFLPEIQLTASASQLYLYQVGKSVSIATAGAFDDWSNAVTWSNINLATAYVSQSQLYLA